MKPGLIFDLDGTLVDSLKGIADSLNHAMESAGFPVHLPDRVRNFIGNGARILIERGAPRGTSRQDLATAELAFKAHYDSHWKTGTEVFHGIPAMLETLQSRGYPLAVLSNKPHGFTESIVKYLFPKVHFSAVLGQRDGIPHKPDPAGALEIAKMLGREVADCALIGDSTVDMETARNAGMRAIAVNWGFHDHERLVEFQPDAILDDVAGLEAMFC